jgi:hypothetical protein
MPFSNNVFINCPFDNEYKPLLKALVFTVCYLEHKPLISMTMSSSNVRIQQIKNYIRKSKFGIHDISRNKQLSNSELPRFNMPFELGLDIGAAEFGSALLKSKHALILDTERYYFQKVISDISGQDIEEHANDPKILIRKVRNWFSNQTDSTIPGPTIIWNAFNQFNADLKTNLTDIYTDEDFEEMPIGDFIKFVNDWTSRFKGCI